MVCLEFYLLGVFLGVLEKQYFLRPKLIVVLEAFRGTLKYFHSVFVWEVFLYVAVFPTGCYRGFQFAQALDDQRR